MVTEPSTALSPSFAQIEPCGTCNLACVMCMIGRPADHRPSPDDDRLLSMSEFERLLTQLGDVPRLHLQGLGEPFLHPLLPDMIAAATRAGMVVTTSTNMTIMSEAMANALLASGLDTLHVSIDSADERTYARTRPGATLAGVLSNLGILTAARAKAGSSLRIVMVAVLQRQTLEGLHELVSLASSFRLDALHVQNLAQTSAAPSTLLHAGPAPGRRDTALAPDDRHHVTAAFAAARAKAAQAGLDIRLPAFHWGDDAPGCRCDWPRTGIYVTYRGDILPCCLAPHHHPLGNALDHDPLIVWRGEELARFRRRMRTSSPPGVCTTCSMYKGEF